MHGTCQQVLDDSPSFVFEHLVFASSDVRYKSSPYSTLMSIGTISVTVEGAIVRTA